jgi:hypothetical protein
MNRWKLVVPVVACVAAVFVTGCATHEEVAVQSPPAPAEVVVQSAPPPEQPEVIPVAPSTEHIWIRGHWHWNGGWVWQPGHYEIRRVGLRWIPAHYDQRGPAFYYIPGHWGR